VACERGGEGREGGAVVKELGGEDEVEACREWPAVVASAATVAAGTPFVAALARTNASAAGTRSTKITRAPRPGGDEAGKTETAAQLEYASRSARHGAGEHERAAPEMRPVGGLGRLVAGQQRRAIDVPLEVGDAPERDDVAVEREARQLGGEVGNFHRKCVVTPQG
jgi:hypothetical protein